MAGYIGSKASVVSSGAERKKTFTITGATTSLTGLNYTVGKVHVFQNGVRLVDGTDYTATNGTTITLTVAAQNGDNVVVISQAAFQVADALLTSGGTMTGDLTVQGAFTSKGIDDNADAVALTIDSSENVMVGVASVQTQSGTTAGTSLYGGSNAGLITAGRNGDVLRLNRQSSDGTILDLRKNGTTIGSIGVVDGDNLFIGSSASDHAGFYFNNTNVKPYVNGAVSDNTMNIGASAERFKDIFISGGIHLGGTGSDNKLSDYETGTFTVSWLGGTISPSNSTAYYTKIGQVVHWQYYSSATTISNAGGGAHARMLGLPFNVLNGVSGYGVVTTAHNSFFGGSATAGQQGYHAINSDGIYFTPLGSPGPSTFVNNSNVSIMVSGTYITAS
jgi:hypothetical protein